MALCFMLVAAQSALPASLIVPTDYPTISEANSAAIEGDTIFVLPGYYTEATTIVLQPGVTLRGLGDRNQIRANVKIRVMEDSQAGYPTIIENMTLGVLGRLGSIVYVGYTANTIIRGNVILADRCITTFAPITIENNVLDSGLESRDNTLTITCSSEGSSPGSLVVRGNQMWVGEGGVSIGGICLPDVLLSTEFTHNTIVNPWHDYYEAEFTCRPRTEMLISSNILIGMGDGNCDPEVLFDYNAFWSRWGLSGFELGDYNVFEDPALCDLGGFDWRLQPDSPCIGTGENGTNIGALGIGCLVDVPQAGMSPAGLLRVAPTVGSGPFAMELFPGIGAQVRITIYDVGGRRVAGILPDAEAGHVFWDGRDAAGRELPGGVYFVRVEGWDRAVGPQRVYIMR